MRLLLAQKRREREKKKMCRDRKKERKVKGRVWCCYLRCSVVVWLKQCFIYPLFNSASNLSIIINNTIE